MKYWTDIRGAIDLREDSSDECKESNWIRNFKVCQDSFNRPSGHSELNIYTDGSKMNERVGAAYVFSKVNDFVTEKFFRLPNYCTVFQAEIKAIKEAAQRLSISQEYKYVRIFVDSQAALRALESKQITSTLVGDTIRTLNIASLGRNITLHWTRAHIGTIGNERADEGAKKGGMLEISDNINVPKAERMQRIEKFFYDQWGKSWNEYKKARMTKLFYINPCKNQAKYILKLGRIELSRFIKIITGHNGLFYFKHRVDPQINPTCRFCLEQDETFYHLVTECPVHRI